MTITDKRIRGINAQRLVPLERYREEGADSRYEYLLDLADIYDVPIADIVALTDVVGPREDFDGLVSMIEDLAAIRALDVREG